MPSIPRIFFRQCSAALFGALCSLLIVPSVKAEQSDFALQFAADRPDTVSAVSLHILYRNPADPNGKPSPIRHLVITAPSGSEIDLSIPRCTATDQQIMASGPSVCPGDSRVGGGSLTADTGFGPPIDPFLTDVSVFNTGQGVVEIVQDHNTGATLADDRLQITGDTMIGNPPSIPGGPPDGQTAVRSIDFVYPAGTHYFTTPPTCPTGRWTSTASFTFADGTIQHLSSTTPCAQPVLGKKHHHKTAKKHHRAKKLHRHRPRDPDHDGDGDSAAHRALANP